MVPLAAAAAAVALATLAVVPAASTTTIYSEPVLNNSYSSETRWNDKGLGPLYGAAVGFARAIQQPDPFPPNLFAVRNGTVVVDKDVELGSVAAYYTGVIATAAAGLLVALLLPLVACCCGCCSRAKAKKAAPCFAPLLLAVLTCLAICFAVIALVANSYANDGVVGLRGRVGAAVSDVKLFIDNGNEEANTILDTNYSELTEALDNILKNRCEETTDLVQGVVDAFPLELAMSVATGMKKVYKDLQDMQTETWEILRTGGNIARGLDEVINEVKAGCQVEPILCDSFLGEFVIPNTTLIEQADTLIESSQTRIDIFKDHTFTAALDNVKNELADVKVNVAGKLDAVRAAVRTSADETHAVLRDKAGNLTASLRSVASEVDKLNKLLSSVDTDYVQHFETYRNIGFIVLGVILLMIPVGTAGRLLIVSCTKNHSYGFLRRDAQVISLLMLLLTSVVTLLFLWGLSSDHVCQALREPEQNQIMHLVDDVLMQQAHSESGLVLHKASYYIRTCHEDKTMYDILELDSVVNINEITDNVKKFSLTKYTEEISRIVNDQISTLNLIPSDTEDAIKRLIDESDPSDLNFDRIKQEIDHVRSTADKIRLDEWARDLESLGLLLSYDFSKEIEKLGALTGDVTKFKNSSGNLANFVPTLESDLRLGQNGSFQSALRTTLNKTDEATDLIRVKAQDMIKLANDTATQFHDEVLGFLEGAVERVRGTALRCGPLARVYDGLLLATCDAVLAPLNGFWASAGACLLLFVLMALLASWLSKRR